MTTPPPSPDARASRREWIPQALLGLWTLVLCFGPDPRPLGTADWIVAMVAAVGGLGEATARVGAALAMRAGGIALLGALVMWSLGGKGWNRRSGLALVLAPCLAVLTLWIDYGYFPIAAQLRVAALSAVLGALAGLALRRNLLAAGAFACLGGGVFVWGTATGVSNDLDAATRATGQHLLAAAAEVPEGDAAFGKLLEIAFAFAAENSAGGDPVLPNRAAILALAVILGEERVAAVAKRHLDASRVPQAEALRARVTLHGRKDWPRHFWVSAGLTLLADNDRSLAVGITKELMDATPGGTGFSFADLAADVAGNRFTLAATRDARSARAMQARILAGVRAADFFPDVRDLPEGLTREAFQEQYGGLGGAGTQRIVDEVRRRLAACAGLR